MSATGKMKLWVLALEVAAVAVVAVFASHFFAAVDAMKVVVAFVVACSIPILVFRRSSHHTPGAEVFLVLSALTITLMAEWGIWNATTAVGLPFDNPHLIVDDSRYFKWALAHYDGRVEAPACTFVGFPLIVVGLWKVLGVSIVWPLALNACVALFAIIVTARMTVVLLDRRVDTKPETVTMLVMLVCCFLFFFLSQAARLQKEALSYLATALCGLALARFSRQESISWKTMAVFALGCAIMAMVRTSFVYFFMIGAVIVSFTGLRKRWRNGLVLVAIAVVIFGAGCLLSMYSFTKQYVTIAGGNAMDQSFVIRGTQQPYLALIGKYFYYPVLKRILLLPLTMSVQFIIPFPWIYDRPGDHTVVSVMTRMRWMWYIVGGITLFYYFFLSWQKGKGLGMWALWPAVVFIIIAYVIGGTVSRYVLPLQILFIPQAVLVVLQLRQGENRKLFLVWAIGYVMVLVCTLIVCYNVQLTYLNNLDEYYRELEAAQ